MEWIDWEIKYLKKNYPKRGLEWCAKKLLRKKSAIRSQASRLGLKQDRTSDFFKNWQFRAAESKKGKKRPLHALYMKSKMKDFVHKEETKIKLCIIQKEIRKNNPHPKGMLGKKHSEQSKIKFSEISKKRWKNMTDEQKMLKTKRMLESRKINGCYAPQRIKCSWKASWREFGGKRHFYRSKWEANYGRYLEFLKLKNEIKDWFHEPDVFWFEKIKRGCVSYLPDFKIINNNDSIEYHEVKGWMDKRSITKIKRMNKYYPNIKLVIIKKKEYNEILNNLRKIIPEWE